MPLAAPSLTVNLDDPSLAYLCDYADLTRLLVSHWENVRTLPETIGAWCTDLKAFPVADQIAARAEADLVDIVGLLAGNCAGPPNEPHAVEIDRKRYVVLPAPDGSPQGAKLFVEDAAPVACCRRPT